MGANKTIRIFNRSPFTVVEFILAVGLVTGGFYILSPFLVIGIELSNAPTVIQTLASDVGLLLLGGLSVITGAACLYGIFARNYKVREQALFFQFLLRMYVVIAIILTNGFFPLGWLSGAMLATITGVCWVNVKNTIRSLKL